MILTIKCQVQCGVEYYLTPLYYSLHLLNFHYNCFVYVALSCFATICLLGFVLFLFRSHLHAHINLCSPNTSLFLNAVPYPSTPYHTFWITSFYLTHINPHHLHIFTAIKCIGSKGRSSCEGSSGVREVEEALVETVKEVRAQRNRKQEKQRRYRRYEGEGT